MARIAIIWDIAHRSRTLQFDDYFRKRGHTVLLVAENTAEASARLDDLEEQRGSLDAVFIGAMPGSDSTQNSERQLAGEFRVSKGSPRIISLLDRPDNNPGIPWHDGFAGKDSTAEAAIVIMNKLLQSRENRDTIRHLSHA